MKMSSISNDNIDFSLENDLIEIGLTKYEARALLTLYQSRDLSAEEISSMTNIPYPRVYDTMELLAKKHLIDILPGRPKRFMVVDPKIGLNTFLKATQEEFMKKLEIIKQKISELIVPLSDLYVKYHTEISPEDLLRPYSGLGKAENVTMKLIESAEKEVLILTNVFKWFSNVETSIKTAAERGVKIRVLMNTEAEESLPVLEKIKEINGVEIRNLTTKTFLARGTLRDNKELLFVIWASSNEKKKKVFKPHYTQNPGMVEIFKNNFEFLWLSSEPLNQ